VCAKSFNNQKHDHNNHNKSSSKGQANNTKVLGIGTKNNSIIKAQDLATATIRWKNYANAFVSLLEH